jgi:eight-cysteine-cluster-containing protein
VLINRLFLIGVLIVIVLALATGLTPTAKDPIESIEPELATEIKDCFATGCSGQVCANEPIITTCEFLPKYQCYKSALCQRQANGRCGWTVTDELRACLDSHR